MPVLTALNHSSGTCSAVLGIDLGTSAVKIIAVNQSGHVITSTSVPLNLMIYACFNCIKPFLWNLFTISRLGLY
jgi:activator of 2-hydroxyglutaryl-CoA dehydratase